jgi:hypothetical protein
MRGVGRWGVDGRWSVVHGSAVVHGPSTKSQLPWTMDHGLWTINHDSLPIDRLKTDLDLYFLSFGYFLLLIQKIIYTIVYH